MNKNQKRYIFIDDSGDPGLKKSNTAHFILAAVIIDNKHELEKIAIAINSFRAGLGWGELDEFKFSSTKKSTIKNLLALLRPFEFTAHAVVIDKKKFSTTTKPPLREALYDYAAKELLLKLKSSNTAVIIDGTSHKGKAQNTRTYLRQSLRQHNITDCNVSFADSRKNQLLQLADIVAGSIARSFDERKSDKNTYTNLLRRKIKSIDKITP